MKKITKDQIASVLDIDIQAGTAIWKSRPREHFQTNRAYSTWNSRYAGKLAGCKTSPHGYWFISINNNRFLLHRIIWIYATGESPLVIDHVDGNPSNNSIYNLRDCSFSENSRNQKKSSANKSGITGVRLHKGIYEAYGKVNRKYVYLGSFKTIEDAIVARKKFETENGFIKRKH